MNVHTNVRTLEKVPTGVEGFEHLSHGGLIKGRTALVVGSSGSGKTMFSLEVIHRGMVSHKRPAVFVTFEERPDDIIRNVSSLNWSFDSAIEQGQLIIVDATVDRDIVEQVGRYDLSGIIAQLKDAIAENHAELVVLDSIGSLFHQHDHASIIRREIHRLTDVLRELGVTSIMTAERTEEHGPISRFGIEEFVSDEVIVLRHDLQNERVRRTLQIYKMRGSRHNHSEFPFVISEDGIKVIVQASMELSHDSTMDRVSSGNEQLDEMSGGGLFQDSIVLVSGPTGGGKTLMCATFAAEACKNQERVLLLGYEESRNQLIRNAESWGIDFGKWEQQGLLRIACQYPESRGIEGHLLDLRNAIEDFKPHRLVVDSVSAMERIADTRGFREFVIGLSSYVKQKQICSLFTCTSPELSGGESITEAHISTITDAIILLRYVGVKGALHRGILIIKMRGSQHEKDVREFHIDSQGMHIGEPFEDLPTVISGVPTASPPSAR